MCHTRYRQQMFPPMLWNMEESGFLYCDCLACQYQEIRKGFAFVILIWNTTTAATLVCSHCEGNVVYDMAMGDDLRMNTKQ